MSENESPPEPEKPKTKEACEEAGGTWNSETSTCTMPKPEPAPEEKAFIDRMLGAVKEYVSVEIHKALKVAKEDIDAAVKANQIEVEQALRKGFGLTKDLPLTTSDIPSLLEQFRKAALENQENRSPTDKPLEKGNPEGTAKKDPFDEAVEKKYEEMS